MKRFFSMFFAATRSGLIIAGILFICSTVMFAAQATIKGTVTDPTGAVISGAKVELLQGTSVLGATITGPSGAFQFNVSDPGVYRVRASAAGFATQLSAPAYAGAGTPLLVGLSLSVGTIQQHVVVSDTGTPIPESQTGIAVTVLTREMFGDRIDVVEPMQQVPGAQIVQSGGRGAAASLFLRGGNSNDNKVLIDGEPMNDIGGVVNFGTIATTGIDRIEVLRGPNSVLYGPDAMAGVVEFSTRRGTTLKPELSYSFDAGNFGSLRHDVSLAGTFRRLDYLGEFSRNDISNALPNSAFHNGTYVTNLGLALNSATQLRFTGRYTTTALGQSNAVDLLGIADDSTQRDQDAYITASFDQQTTMRWHNLLRYGAARLRLQDENPSPSGILDPLSGNFLGLPTAVRGANGFTVSGQAILDFAGDYPQLTSSSTKRDSVYFQSDYSFTPQLTGLFAFRFEQERGFTLAFGSATNADRGNYSYIGEVHGSLGSRAYATVGGSIERNEVFGTAAIPRASLAYYLVRPRSTGMLAGTKLRGGYGQGIREPKIFEETSSLFGLLSGPGGDPALISQFHLAPIAAERSRSIDAGVEQMLASGKVKLSATYFHNQFTNQIEFVPNTALPLLGVPQPVADASGFGATINSGDLRAQGVETELDAALGHGFSIRGAYTYLDAVVQRSFTSDAFNCSPPNPQPFCANPAFPGIPIGAFAPLVGARPFRRAPQTGSFRLGYSREKLNLFLNGYLVSRRDDSTFLTDANFGNTLLLPNHNLAAAYQKLDFEGGYRVNPRLRFFSVIENLASQHYDPVFGFRALPLTFRLGAKVTLGGESWK